MPVTLIEGDLSSELAAVFEEVDRVAVDTETGGLDWSSDRLHILQLFSPQTGTVVLRNAEEKPPKRLARLMSDPDVVKVFHHAPFDLKFLDGQWGVRCASVVCTKAASKLLDPRIESPAHSLQAVLDRYLGVRIQKGTVRTSDWGARVLSEEQLAYAAGDVVHLLALYDVLEERLSAAEQLADLYRQVCEYMPVAARLAVMRVPDPLHY